MRTFRNTFAVLVILALVGVLGASCMPPDLTGSQQGSGVYLTPGGAKLVVGTSGVIEFEGATADAFETVFAITDPTADRTITIGNSSGTVALNPYGASIEFEGATADEFETTLTVVDPTVIDKTITLPNETGAVMVSSLTTNGTDVANSVTGASNGLVFEVTADAFETTVSATAPTADRSVVLPDAGGTVMLSSLATNGADAANSVTGASNGLVFEVTADAFETTLSATNPTADRAVVFADAGGTVMLSALATNGADAANAVTGASNALLFEGATANDFEGSLAPADVTADRTWTLPDLSGTALLQQAAPTAGASGDFLDMTATDSASDGTDTTIGLDMNLTGAAATGTGNKLYGLDLGLTTADAQQTEVGLIVNDADWEYSIDAGDVPAIFTAQTWWHDFMGDAVQAEVLEFSGTDPQAVQAIVQEQFGVYQITSGDDGANCAADCEGFNAGLVYQADQGSLVFQARLHIDDITNAIVCVGLTDSAGVEMPATIGVGTDTPAIVADDFLAFCYDSGSTTDNWFVLGAAATVEGTGIGVVSGVAPVNGVYQTFRIEVDAGGNDARFYIGGTEVGTCTAGCITITDPLTPVVVVDTNAAASVVVDLDYVYASAQRQ